MRRSGASGRGTGRLAREMCDCAWRGAVWRGPGHWLDGEVVRLTRLLEILTIVRPPAFLSISLPPGNAHLIHFAVTPARRLIPSAVCTPTSRATVPIPVTTVTPESATSNSVPATLTVPLM
jgi:hypothetical protein